MVSMPYPLMLGIFLKVIIRTKKKLLGELYENNSIKVF
jgi:hypothetical protein